MIKIDKHIQFLVRKEKLSLNRDQHNPTLISTQLNQRGYEKSRETIFHKCQLIDKAGTTMPILNNDNIFIPF